MRTVGSAARSLFAGMAFIGPTIIYLLFGGS
jgi:hypothetical protein